MILELIRRIRQLHLPRQQKRGVIRRLRSSRAGYTPVPRSTVNGTYRGQIAPGSDVPYPTPARTTGKIWLVVAGQKGVGADYGPETPGTQTSGIAEALANSQYVFLLPHQFNLYATVSIGTGQILRGSGTAGTSTTSGSQLVPQANVDAITVTAPAGRWLIADLAIVDFSSLQTSTGAIYLDHSGTNGEMNGGTIQNVGIQNTFNGIYSPDKASDYANGIVQLTLLNISINYRGDAVSITDFFDSSWSNVEVVQAGASSGYGFKLLNTTNSGDVFWNLQAEGQVGTAGSGFYLQSVTDFKFVSCHADTMAQGWTIAGTVDKLTFVDCSAYSSSAGDGWAFQHTSGTCFLDTCRSANNSGVGIHNVGNGGHVTWRGGFVGDPANGGGDVSLASGDWISECWGYNPQGFAVTTPAVPGTTVPYTNSFPFRIRIYFLTAGTVSAVSVTDPLGNAASIAGAVTAGEYMQLDPGAKITFTYTVAPTWRFYGA